jgi:hypothetical protein
MTIYDQLQTNVGQLNYVVGILAAGNLDDWEIKEYEGLKSDYIYKIDELRLKIKAYELM